MAILTVRDKNGNPIEIPALQGKTGKTAYQYAQEGGYEGTENEFMELLAKAANNSKVEVSYKQTLEGGIKIGHFTVDGVSTDICAPAAGESVGDGNDNQTIKVNEITFSDNAEINLEGSGMTTVVADKSNNKIIIHTPEVTDVGNTLSQHISETDGRDKLHITNAERQDWNAKATTLYVDQKVASIVDSSPETLNTLNELAAALGDDPNFATTVATQIGNKADQTALEGHINATSAHTVSQISDLTATATELNYMDGVTSNVQQQLNSKQATITGGATTITNSNLAVSRALVSNASGKVAVSEVTSTELGYMSGATSNIQTQIDSHTTKTDIHINDNERTNWNASYTHSTSAHAPADAQANVLESVKVNGTAVTITNKTVDISVPTGALASKNTVEKTDLTEGVQISLGKADTALQSYTETDPTVPAWAKADTKPTYTANEVKAVSYESQTLTDAQKTQVRTNIGAQSVISGAATSITDTNLTASKALVSDAAGKISVSNVSSTELNCLTGATSNIQTQLDRTAKTSKDLVGRKALYSNAVGCVAESLVTDTELNCLTGVTSRVQVQLDGKLNKYQGHENAGKVLLVDTNGNIITGNPTIEGAVEAATKLSTARTISLTGDASGSTSFDGSADVSINVTVNEADSAYKLTTDDGSKVQPIYFKDGVPVAIDYTIEKSVPSNAVFTDTDTHYESKNVVGSSSATSNTTTKLGNGEVYLNSVENGVVTSSHKISGSGATEVTTDASGNIIISSTDTYRAAGTDLGLVKSGGDVTIEDGIITVNDDSHSHSNYLTEHPNISFYAPQSHTTTLDYGDSFSVISGFSRDEDGHVISYKTGNFILPTEDVSEVVAIDVGNGKIKLIEQLKNPQPGLYESFSGYKVLKTSWEDLIANGTIQIDENRQICTGYGFEDPSAAFDGGNPNSSADALEGDLVIPSNDSVSNIISYGFAGCNKLTGVKIPDDIWGLYPYVFSKCYNLNYVILPNDLNGIYNNAFEGDLKLTSCNIPETVTNIGMSAFEGCRELLDYDNEMNVAYIDNWIVNRGNYPVEDTYVAFAPRAGTRGIADGVHIGGWINYFITSIDLPDGLKYIGHDAFPDLPDTCTHIIIPNSVEYIGPYAFFGGSENTVIYYTGTEEEWNAINKSASWNQGLLSTTIIFGYTRTKGIGEE